MNPRARAFAFMATSLDGYIARVDGGIDWLDKANQTITPGEDCGFAAFFAGIDVLAMGRNSFEQVVRFPTWFYGDKPVIVLSRREVPIPEALRQTVSCSTETPAELLQRLGDEGRRSVYVDGGLTLQSFLRQGLVDELTITTIPVLLGRGLPLFGTLDTDVELELLDSRHWPFGFVQNRWRVRPAAAPSAGSAGCR